MTKSSKHVMVTLFFVVLALAGFWVSLSFGSVELSQQTVWQAIWDKSDKFASLIIWNMRLPRTILAILVGINLALSGALLQSVMHNPLADPNIIGVSSGAGLAGIIVLVLFPNCEFLLTPFSFAGALMACFLVYMLAWRDGTRPVRIVLAGVAVSAFLGSIITSLLIFYGDRVQGALLWMVGGLSGRGWEQVSLIWPYTVIGLFGVAVAARYLNILQLGDEMARGLGINVERCRFSLTVLAALLAASSVSVAGLLGFVGLVVPHIVRLLLGSDYRILLPATAVLGGAILMFSDTLARVLLDPVELPVGILMAFLGAPFFLYLLRKNR